MDYYENDTSVFKCGRIFCCFKGIGKQMGAYSAGMLFALGWWAFIDGLAILWNLQDRKIAPGIEDWAPGIITTFGMIVVNLIDKESLRGSGFIDQEFVWRARLFLFLGFALMAGGFSGSVAVLVTKYIYNQELDFLNIYLGIADVVQNTLIMLSTAILWLAQSAVDQQYYQI